MRLVLFQCNPVPEKSSDKLGCVLGATCTWVNMVVPLFTRPSRPFHPCRLSHWMRHHVPVRVKTHSDATRDASIMKQA